jgi:protein-tyrosine phosphatase
MVRRLLYDVVRAGFTPVIAHPERSPLLASPAPRNGDGGILGTLRHLFPGRGNGGTAHGPGGNGHGERTQEGAVENPLVAYLRDLGCSFQGNLGSFSGFYGGQVKATAESMRGAGLYDRYGTDSHTVEQALVVLQSNLKVG